MNSFNVEIAQKLLSQIDEESVECSFWLFSSVQRFLKDDPEISLMEFYKILQKTNSQTFHSFFQLKDEKGIKIIY